VVEHIRLSPSGNGGRDDRSEKVRPVARDRARAGLAVVIESERDRTANPDAYTHPDSDPDSDAYANSDPEAIAQSNSQAHAQAIAETFSQGLAQSVAEAVTQSFAQS
jgi:flagellar biosynthesis/type III secretory pathway protein FliH